MPNKGTIARRWRVALGQHCVEKSKTCIVRHCALPCSAKESALSAFGGDGIMNPRRFATVAALLCGTVVLEGTVVASLVSIDSAGINHTGARPIEDGGAEALAAGAELGDLPQATAPLAIKVGNAAVAGADGSIENHRPPAVTAERADIPQAPAAQAAAPPPAAVANTAVASADAPIEDHGPPALTADAERADTPPATAVQATAPQATEVGSTAVTGADAPIVDRGPPALAAGAEAADTPQAPAPQATVGGSAPVAKAQVAIAAESVAITGSAPALDDPESVAEASSPDSPRTPPGVSPPMQVATANPDDPLPSDARSAVGSSENLDQCQETDACIDRYLWSLYQRTPKLDSIEEHEQRKVTVKKRGRKVTVTRSFAKLVDEDFAWKDPKAAEKAGMPMMDYVIGGMDRGFKLRLFHLFHAAEEAGLSPGITSAFRDDYRQSIASGLKAATNRSYHGGSFRGGYGHGLAADAVSVKGETKAERWISTEAFWKWVDARGGEFGIARPYLDRDPPHLAPIDGQEYADHHRGGTKVQRAESDTKKRTRLAARDDHSVAKRRVARSSKARTI
jgi:hypothetical protein